LLFCNTKEFKTLLLTYINKNKDKRIVTTLVTWQNDTSSTDITHRGLTNVRQGTSFRDRSSIPHPIHLLRVTMVTPSFNV